MKTCRRTFSTLLVLDGESGKTVGTMMGHSERSTLALTTYTHVAASHLDAASARLDRILQNQVDVDTLATG